MRPKNATHVFELRSLSEAWRNAAIALDIIVFAPVLAFEGTAALELACLLPHFGGPRGMLIGAARHGEDELASAEARHARRWGLYCSFLSEAYGTYKESAFRDALVDWGYFGPPELRPQWYPRPTVTC